MIDLSPLSTIKILSLHHRKEKSIMNITVSASGGILVIVAAGILNIQKIEIRRTSSNAAASR
jgi:hypothetical protein